VALTERLLERWQTLVLGEIGRARERVRKLRRKHPGASPDEIAVRLIRTKQYIATAGGAVSGLFGAVTLPADFAFVTYLEVALILEIATVFGATLKTPRAQREVLEVLEYARGAKSSLVATTLTRIAGSAVRRLAGKLPARAIPLVAAPVSAAMHRRALGRVGETAVRFYGTMNKLPRPAQPH